MSNRHSTEISMATTAQKTGNRAPRKRTRKTMRRYADPRPLIKQAASDLERGLEDTDCRVRDKPLKSHCKG
jgi:hypothetical protein